MPNKLNKFHAKPVKRQRNKLLVHDGTEAEIQLPLKRFPYSSVFPNPSWLV